jgi:hypothetical protein
LTVVNVVWRHSTSQTVSRWHASDAAKQQKDAPNGPGAATTGEAAGRGVRHRSTVRADVLTEASLADGGGGWRDQRGGAQNSEGRREDRLSH